MAGEFPEFAREALCCISAGFHKVLAIWISAWSSCPATGPGMAVLRPQWRRIAGARAL